MKRIALVLLAMLTVVSFTACSSGRFMKESEIKDIENPTGTIKVAYYLTDDDADNNKAAWTETMSFELYYQEAPITVTNFVKLAKEGFYNGTIFHAIETIDTTDTPKVYVGGRYSGFTEDADDNYKRSDLIEKSTDKKYNYKIKGEFEKNGWEPTVREGVDLEHTAGAMGMYRDENNMDSASKAFYFTSGTAAKRDGYYAIFGRVTSNSKILTDADKFASVTTSEFTNEDGKKWYNMPNGILRIVEVTVDTNGVDLGEPLKI